MWIHLALRGVEIAHVDADLAWYRIHDNNMVNNRVQMLTWLLEAAQLIRGRIPADISACSSTRPELRFADSSLPARRERSRRRRVDWRYSLPSWR